VRYIVVEFIIALFAHYSCDSASLGIPPPAFCSRARMFLQCTLWRSEGDRHILRSVIRQLYALLCKNVSCLIAIDALVPGNPIYPHRLGRAEAV